MKRFLYISILIGVIAAGCGGEKEIALKDSKLNTPFRNTFHDALTLKMIGRYDTAAVLFEECLMLDPTSHACHAALSDIYEKFGENDKAFSNAEKAYNLSPENPFYIKRMAQLYYNRENFSKSVEYFEKVIAEEKNLQIKFTFTDALMRSGNYKRAIEMIDELEVELGQSPQFAITKHDLYTEIGQPEKAAAEISNLLNDNPGNLEFHHEVADYYLNTKQSDKAKQLAEKMKLIKPSSGLAYMITADIFLRDHKYTEAFGDLETAFKADDVPVQDKSKFLQKLMNFAFIPGNPDAATLQSGLSDLYITLDSLEESEPELLAHQANFLMLTGEARKAAEILRKVVDTNPNNYENWEKLVQLQYDSWQYEGCAETAETAIDYFPSQPYFYLMKGYSEIKNKNFDKAQEYIYLGRDLIVKNPALSAEFEVVLGMIYKEKEEYVKAIEYYNKAKKTDEASVWPYIEEAYALAANEKKNEAYAVLDNALSKFPSNSNVLDAYGNIYFKEKNYSEAIKKYEKALANKSYTSVVLEHYGDALFLTDKVKDAVDIWEESKKQGNFSPVLRRKIEDKQYYAE